MPKHPQKVLVVDDEPSMHRYLTALLAGDSVQVHSANSGKDALELLRDGLRPQVVLLDVLMPEMDGIETLAAMRRADRHLNVVMMSCVSETTKVVEAMRLGAQDYLTKPFAKDELDTVLQRYLQTIGQPEHLVGEVEELGDGLFFFCASPEMKRIRAQVDLVANVNIPVLLLGESGTGKEIIARLVHQKSNRATKPFIKVNCAALPDELLESELFGYEAGAFTGAGKMKPGKFEQCDGGTLLLDEIGEMPTRLQAKLLHVLQDGEFSRLGGRKPIKVDVRVLAATNINVEKSIANKSFREDLYYRLNAFSISLPALRERRGEIPLLMRQMVNRMCESYGRPSIHLSQDMVNACLEANWPGNVRELNNFVKRFIFMGDERDAIAELRSSQGAANPRSPQAEQARVVKGRAAVAMSGAQRSRNFAPLEKDSSDLKTLIRNLKGEAEAQAIARALAESKWDQENAARLLNITQKTLLSKMRQHGIRSTPAVAAGLTRS